LYEQQREYAATVLATILSCSSVLISQNFGPVCNHNTQEFDSFWYSNVAREVTAKTPHHLPFPLLCTQCHR